MFDLSYSLTHIARGPRGVDRVQTAYARFLLSSRYDLKFVATTGNGNFGLLPDRLARHFARGYDVAWMGRRRDRFRRLWLICAAWLFRLDGLLFARHRLTSFLARTTRAPIYILIGFRNLQSAEALRSIRSMTGAKFLLFVHDLDPILFPALFPPGHKTVCLQRMTNVATFADVVVVPSRVTADHFKRICTIAPSIVVNPLASGIPLANCPHGVAISSGTYFVCVGTIEPRKNQRMLLDVWHALLTAMGKGAPRLVLIGQRGWDRNYVESVSSACRMLGSDLVRWYPRAADSMVQSLLCGAQALLMPTLAEGFGLPLVEALDFRTPVIASDLEVLREVGGEIPEYLNPLDPIAWKEAIVEWCDERSLRRVEYIARLQNWKNSDWNEHFATIGQVLDDLNIR